MSPGVAQPGVFERRDRIPSTAGVLPAEFRSPHVKSASDDRGTQEFAALLEAFEKKESAAEAKRPAVGDRVSAKIVGFGEESAFVDLGRKAEGIVPLAQLTDDEGKRTVAVGDSVDGVVASIQDDVVVLKVRAGRGPAAPEEIQQAYTHGLPVDGTVHAVVKGGVEVMVSGLRAFCPISQLDLRYVEDPAGYLGQKFVFRITRYEEGRGRPNLVLSRRVLLEEEAAAKAAEARARIEVGKVVRGRVTSLTSYGAFVDLGGIEGMIHVSELGHGRVADPKDVLQIGDEVEVQVKSIGAPDASKARGRAPGGSTRERIALSRRALTQDPWNEEAAKLHSGARRTGKVARLEAFGAFVELAPGVDGLLHVSELAGLGKREIRHPRDVLKVGQPIEVTILSVAPETRRIALALVRPGQDDEAEAAASAAKSAGGGSFGALGSALSRALGPAAKESKE
jgi:small subunit ribosomal protein S1